MQITKLYENTTNEDITVNGVGLIPAGERLSVTSEYPTPVNLANYPGIAEVSGLSADEHQAKLDEAQARYKQWKTTNPNQPTPGVRQDPAVPPAAPTASEAGAVEGNLDIQKNPGGQTNA